MGITKYPKYLKAPERGLYIRIEGPFDYQCLRLLQTETGANVGVISTESSHITTSFLEDSGYRASSAEEYAQIAARIKKHINETFPTL